jgi:hypothetical protein
VKFPKVIQHRKVEVTINEKKKSYPFYRLAYRVNGRRQMRSFSSYGEAKAEADKKLRELDMGSQSLSLTAKEVTDALVIRDTLDADRRETGRTITALQAVTHYVQAAKLLGERPLGEAVEGYLQNVAVVRRKALSEVVENFVALRAPKAEAKDGKRSALDLVRVRHRDLGITLLTTQDIGQFGSTGVPRQTLETLIRRIINRH